MSTVEAVQTTKSTPSTTTSGMVLQRKCACGGSAGLSGECERCKTNKLLGKPLQKKLAVSEPGDEYEQEADRVAEQMMRMSLLTPKNGQTSLSSVMLHRRTSEGASGHVEVPSIVHEVLSSSGKQLDQATRNYFEPRFGHDFSRVRVHVDQKAAQSAQAVNASAYTVGQNVVFSRGQFAPGSHDGNRLLAHELTHVVQQSRSRLSPTIYDGSELGSGAHGADGGVVNEKRAALVKSASELMVARETKSPGDVLYEVKFPEGVKRFTAAEFESQKQEAIRRLRSRLKLTAGLAEVGRTSQTEMLKEYHGGVESFSDLIRKPKALIGIAADMKAGVTPPYIGMWSHPKTTSERGLTALDQGDIGGAARLLESADSSYRDAMREWNAYREATIGGAEAVASNLETVRDVSFAIALVAGAAVAAPMIAGAVGTGAGGLGLTGVAATGTTAVGTAGATGLLGAGLGGGSTALASYANTGKVDLSAAARDATKFGKQGVVTGLTAGLGSALGASGKAAELAKPLVQQALKRCLTEAGVNVAGEVTTAALDKVLPEVPGGLQPQGESRPSPQTLLPGPVRVALTGCVGGALGVPVERLKPGAVRKGVDLALGAGVRYADARLSGQDNKAALEAAAQSTLTSALIQHAQPRSNRSAGKKNVEPSPQANDMPAKIVESPSKSATAVSDGLAKPPVAEKVAEEIKVSKVSKVEDVAPAILKEDAIAKKPTDDGHEAVVTKQGVAKCSPSPCPVIHVEYAKELAEFPKLKERNDKIQALRKTNPDKAAIEAADLIRTLEAARANAAKSGGDQSVGSEMSFELHIGEKRAEQIRSGEKNFAIDRVLTFDIDEVLPVGAADIKPQRAVARALDPYNRQLLDPNSNQRTKGLGIDPRELRENRGEHKPVSVVGNSGALITRRFSEVHELKRIFDRAVASVKERQKLTPTELKARINKETRRIITEDQGPDAVAIREALAALGFEHQPGRGFTMMKEPPP